MVELVNAPEKEKQKEGTITLHNYNYNTGPNILINRKQRRHGYYSL